MLHSPTTACDPLSVCCIHSPLWTRHQKGSLCLGPMWPSHRGPQAAQRPVRWPDRVALHSRPNWPIWANKPPFPGTGMSMEWAGTWSECHRGRKAHVEKVISRAGPCCGEVPQGWEEKLRQWQGSLSHHNNGAVELGAKHTYTYSGTLFGHETWQFFFSLVFYFYLFFINI